MYGRKLKEYILNHEGFVHMSICQVANSMGTFKVLPVASHALVRRGINVVMALL